MKILKQSDFNKIYKTLKTKVDREFKTTNVTVKTIN